MQEPAPSFITACRGILRDLGRVWPQLAVTDALAKTAGFLLLSLLAFVPQLLLFSGDNPALSDEEILTFFLSPIGLLSLISVGTVIAALGFCEQSCLLAVCHGALRDRHVSYVRALRHAGRHAVGILRLATQMIVQLLLIALPFLAAGGAVYLALLTDHDINYYLTDRPSEFRTAVLIVGALGIVLAALLARLIVSWVFALPALLFDGAAPREALRTSIAVTKGRRLMIAKWLTLWALASLAVSAVLTSITGFISRAVIPLHSESLTWVAIGIGAGFVVAILGNVVISFLSGSLFSLMIVRLYDVARPGSGSDRLLLEGTNPISEQTRFRIRKKGVLWASLASVVAAGGLALLMLNAADVEDQIGVAAHRGASGAAPENSLAAVERAIVDRADWVEIDVQESADGVVVVAHDQDFMKTSGVPTRVWEATHAELAEIDIGSYFAPEFSDQRVPTLQQVLELCRGKVRVIIELKYYGHAKQLEQRVVDLVEATGMVDDVVIMSLSYAGVMKMKEIRPDWTYGLLSAVALGDLTRLDVDFIAVNAGMARRSLIRRADSQGQQVFAWTINDAAQMSAMITLGVDVLITDEPALVRTVLSQRAEMNPAERLIVAFGVRFGLVEGARLSSERSDA